MFGVQRALSITSPAPDARVAGLDEIQVNAYHTSDEIERVRYRLDRGGAWRDLRASGAFTWFGALPGSAKLDTGRHTLEVEATADGGAALVADGDVPRDRRQGAEDRARGGLAAVPRRRGAQRRGRRTRSSPSKLGLAWVHRTPGVILTGSPVVADGVAYVGTRDEDGLDTNAVHAVDLSTGRALWAFHTDASVHGTLAVADGIVYAPTIHGTLHAIDAASARELWKREAERPEPPLRRRAYSYYGPAVDDGKVYWPYQTRHGKASSGLLTALDVKTGAHRLGVADDRRDDVRRHARGRRRHGLRRQRDGRPDRRLRRRHGRAQVDVDGAPRRLAGRGAGGGRRARVHRLQQRRDRA